MPFMRKHYHNKNISLIGSRFIVACSTLLNRILIKVRLFQRAFVFPVFFLLKNLFSLPQQIWSSCWPAVKWRRGRGKGGFVSENSAIYKWLPLVGDIPSQGFVFRWLVARSASWRKEPCHPSLILCTQLDHCAQYYLLSLLAFLVLLLFLRFITHVTDFRCIRSQVLEIWDNLKITDAKPSCLGQHLQRVYEIKQNSCSGWLIFTRASPFPIRDQNACDLCALSFSMEIRMSSVTYLTLLSFLAEYLELQPRSD